jgi:hypothetical protein
MKPHQQIRPRLLEVAIRRAPEDAVPTQPAIFIFLTSLDADIDGSPSYPWVLGSAICPAQLLFPGGAEQSDGHNRYTYPPCDGHCFTKQDSRQGQHKDNCYCHERIRETQIAVRYGNYPG